MKYAFCEVIEINRSIVDIFDPGTINIFDSRFERGTLVKRERESESERSGHVGSYRTTLLRHYVMRIDDICCLWNLFVWLFIQES